MRTMIILAAAVAAIAATPAAADLTVISGSGQRALQVAYYGPVGQSFTATDTDLTSFGFQFETFNPGQPYAPLTFTLRDGAGLTGAVIATRTATLPVIPATRVGTWYDFDLTGTTLALGHSYTALVSTTSALLGFVYGPDINIYTGVPLGSDAYAGGALVTTRDLGDRICASGICDANFRLSATTPAAAVPEPAAWALFITGFGMIGAASRRRSARFA
ncbi:PEPxxWA-CTERM sorting domain-containing protein [Polymorphobacter sp. PAMC 29334]|uniref:PEPxxWA-CTERM sorting domain-containing protein n=1 Tax=Polymorphobacter sp. PAMC 29334 TaxID=2862331 RepID=UPI001D0359E7|nr:PEPxxWA-CTERM sorting domain-containing protein [Polymorphobacter sp. PAMC 29334]